jgi:uncharacterized protein (DUF58 family)
VIVVRRVGVVPAPAAIAILVATSAALLVALVLGLSVGAATRIAAAMLGATTASAAIDYLRSRRQWRNGAPRLTRRLPAAFALGVRREISLSLEVAGHGAWDCELHDYVDASLATERLPLALRLSGGTRVTAGYAVVPTRRGAVTFAPAEMRIRSRWRLWDLLERIGATETRRVYPDFAQVARYAWLAGDRRLQEIGIKTYHQRGHGTDFKQLSEYRIGDSVRHIDWRATMRLNRPIVREFQDERDQCVHLLVDCGRRMRADDRRQGLGASHFDQVLNAVMLLAYVALREGDEVGAMTFGTPSGQERWFPPRKGTPALNALMGELYAVEPTPTHSDYLAAAQAVMRRQAKRALVIVITNFRDEDGAELRQALHLLRSRHLVLLASLRERVVGEMMAAPLSSDDAVIDVASAHLYEQARRAAFQRLAARDAMMVDAEPADLGAQLVNRYVSIKRAGMI